MRNLFRGIACAIVVWGWRVYNFHRTKKKGFMSNKCHLRSFDFIGKKLLLA